MTGDGENPRSDFIPGNKDTRRLWEIFETCFKKRCWWGTDGPGLPSIFMSALISLCLPLGNSAFISLPGHQIEQSGALCHSSVAVEIGESM